MKKDVRTESTGINKKTRILTNSRWGRTLHYIRAHWVLYAMLSVGIILYFLFHYRPMTYLLVAFQKYSPKKGLFGSKWVGLKNFTRFFKYNYFWRILKNTLLLNISNMLWTTPINIIFALMINELRQNAFRKTTTTILYLPHFISGVVVIALFNQILMPSGLLNQAITYFGGEKLNLLTEPKYFRTIYNLICVWQETGWGTIIYVAALAGIDQNLYEAAAIDGAGKIRQCFSISLPGIASTIAIQFIINLGYLLSSGTDRVLLLYNERVYETADIIGTYIYRVGLLNSDFGYATAVGLFQSLIGLLLVVVTNKISKKCADTSLF